MQSAPHFVNGTDINEIINLGKVWLLHKMIALSNNQFILSRSLGKGSKKKRKKSLENSTLEGVRAR